MSLVTIIEKNKIFDLIYRLFLWVTVALFINFFWNNISGDSQKILSEIDPRFTWNITQIGIVLLFIKLIFQEFWNSIPSIFSKIVSDLILAIYTVLSYILGWFLYHLYFDIEIIFIILLLFVFGFLSFLARSKKGDVLYDKWYASPEHKKGRIIFLLAFIIIFYFI